MARKSSSNNRPKATSDPPPGTSPAAETIANNLDLLSEILVRLPAKSLIQFESVSKHWMSLYSYEISASDNSKRLNTVSFRGHHNLPSLTFLDGLRGDNDSKHVIQHSLNGLILLIHFDCETTSYIVCNPTTKKCKTLPPGWFSKPPHLAYLAFDPSKSPCYKVVLISMSTSPRYCVDVYSSHDASWDHMFVADRCFNSTGVFWNGAIHWLSDGNGILRFDVDAMEMTAIPSPTKPKILPSRKILYFGECGERLVLAQSRWGFVMEFRLLELDKDYSGWSVKCQVDLTHLRSEFPEMHKLGYKFFRFRVLYVLKGEKEKDFVVVLAIPGRVISYKLRSKAWDVLPGLCLSASYDGGAYPFVETLFPV